MRIPAAVFVVLALSLTGCRAVPLFDAAIGWASSEALTGPRVQVGVGEYGPAEDTAVLDGLRALEAKAAQADRRAEELAQTAAAAKAAADAVDAKVASGALTPEQGAAIRTAAGRAEQAVLDAQAAIARATAADVAAKDATARAVALDAKAEEIAKRVGSAPPIPTDWTPTGILAGLVGLGGWLVRRRAASLARAEADRAREEALAAQRDALAAYDAAPFTAEDAASLAAAASPKPAA